MASLFAQGAAVDPRLLYARRRPVRIDFDRDWPEPRKGQPLHVGFPEMRLSPDLTRRLRAHQSVDEARNGTSRLHDVQAPELAHFAPEGRHGIPSARETAMLDHLRTMDAFLATQQQVMAAFLAPGGPSPGSLRTRGLVPAGADLDQLARSRTLRQVIDVINAPRTSRPAAGPWVGEIESLDPGRSLVAVRRLDAREDPVAEHHTLGGRHVSAIDPDRKGLPVVPFTVMSEMLAQAAAILVPDGVLVALKDVQANKWIRYEDEPILLEIRARRELDTPREVRVAIQNLGTLSAKPGWAGARAVEGVVVLPRHGREL